MGTNVTNAALKPGWYRGGAGGAEGPTGELWQWWDGAAWKALEPGDQKAAEKQLNGRIGMWVMGVIAVLVVGSLGAAAIMNSLG